MQPSTRLEQSEKLRAEYPTFVPITLERYRYSQLPAGNFRLMLPGNRKIQDVVQTVVQRLRQQGVVLNKSGIFLFNVNELNVVFNPGQTLNDIIMRNEALRDGWLDLVYHDHETF